MVETKDKILQSAITIWGSNFTASLDDIASNIGISRRTLHRHFQGRDDLVKSLFSYLIEIYLNSIKTVLKTENTIVGKLQALLINDIKSTEKYLTFCQLYETHPEKFQFEQKKIEEINSIYSKLFKKLRNEKFLSNQLSLEWIEAFYFSVVNTAIKSIQAGIQMEQCSKMAWNSLWNGIKK